MRAGRTIFKAPCKPELQPTVNIWQASGFAPFGAMVTTISALVQDRPSMNLCGLQHAGISELTQSCATLLQTELDCSFTGISDPCGTVQSAPLLESRWIAHHNDDKSCGNERRFRWKTHSQRERSLDQPKTVNTFTFCGDGEKECLRENSLILVNAKALNQTLA